METKRKEELSKKRKLRRANLVSKYKDRCIVIDRFVDLTKKIRNGKTEDALHILENLNDNARNEILEYRNFEFFQEIINFIDFGGFLSFLGLLEDQKIREMAYAQNGVIFEYLTLNACFSDINGKNMTEDFIKKAQFFLRIDKKFFNEVFQKKVKELEQNEHLRSEKTEMAFNSLIKNFEISESEESKILPKQNINDSEELSLAKKKMYASQNNTKLFQME